MVKLVVVRLPFLDAQQNAHVSFVSFIVVYISKREKSIDQLLFPEKINKYKEKIRFFFR